MLKDNDKIHHQDTKNTKFHQEKQGITLVPLGELGGLVVRYSR
jgi:hypothetical protein